MSVKIKGSYLQVIFCLLAAQAATMLNLQGSFLMSFSSQYYWTYLAGNFFLVLTLMLYVRFAARSIGKRFYGRQDSQQILIWQVVLGLLLPAVLAFVLVTLFLELYNVDVLKSGFLNKDFPFLFCILLIANIYYLAVSKLIKLKSESTAREFAVSEAAIIKQEAGTETSIRELKTRKEVIVVDTPTKSIPIRTESIAYGYISGRYVFIRTTDMQSLGESYQISWSLKALEEALDKRQFFRINRRMIVNFDACRYYAPGRNKTLEVFLDPEPYPKNGKMPAEHERLHIVSEDRAASFKLWMDR